MKNKSIIFLPGVLIASMILLDGCKKEDEAETPTVNYCIDSIQNNGETGTDCGGSCVTCINATTWLQPFYMQFKDNGGAFEYWQQDDPSYTGNMSHDTSYMETGFGIFQSMYGFAVRYAGNPTLLAGKKLSFNFNAVPSAKMIFYDNSNNELRTSVHVSDQSGSNCYIDSVVLVSTEPWLGATRYIYAARGNFNCKVSESNGNNPSSVTYGKFSIRLEYLQ